MSQGSHQGLFSFSDGFDRASATATTQDQQHHLAQQSRRDNLRVHGFEPTGHPLVPIEEEGSGEPGNMLSEMFNFPSMPGGLTATDLLAYRLPTRPAAINGDVGFSGDWYGGNRQELNAESEAAMQLFLTNPPLLHPRSPPSPPSPPVLTHHHQAFQGGSFSGGIMGESQGLSLSLSSSLQQFEMAKAEELRVRDGMWYFNNIHQQQQQRQNNPSLHLQDQSQQSQGNGQLSQHMGYGQMGVMNVLRSSKYARAAQELLEEFCSVGRGQLKGSRIGRLHASSSSNPNPNSSSVAGSSSSKDLRPLSSADRFEHQRKKSKLLSMLDEVDRRYNHYCDQMKLVVNSFDSVMGFGAATPYTALAQKAMSRHFRCLKDAIAEQLKKTCELLGEKEVATVSSITKGETPRLRLLDQSLRQQRAFHQMGMMEQEAWRPQRGLPERSVSILRAWLFEHFLHPYPSDADKHLLSRQTGLSRNQVSNWFINARVRLWKPMVEEMYQKEAKDDISEDNQLEEEGSHQRAQSPTHPQGQRPESDAPESSPNSVPITLHQFSGSHQSDDAVAIDAHDLCGPDEDLYRQYGSAAAIVGPVTRMRFGASAATAGDVSLTLGLRHAGNAPEKNRFMVRDFGGC